MKGTYATQYSVVAEEDKAWYLSTSGGVKLSGYTHATTTRHAKTANGIYLNATQIRNSKLQSSAPATHGFGVVGLCGIVDTGDDEVNDRGENTGDAIAEHCGAGEFRRENRTQSEQRALSEPASDAVDN